VHHGSQDCLSALLQHSEIQAYVNSFDFGTMTDGCFYIYACDKNRNDETLPDDEAIGFMRNRVYGNAIKFTKNQLYDTQKRRVLYEGNNAINANAIEKAVPQRFELVEKAKRLWKVADAGGMDNKRAKTIPYPHVVGIIGRKEGL
jgi:hypothetical protein